MTSGTARRSILTLLLTLLGFSASAPVLAESASPPPSAPVESTEDMAVHAARTLGKPNVSEAELAELVAIQTLDKAAKHTEARQAWKAFLAAHASQKRSAAELDGFIRWVLRGALLAPSPDLLLALDKSGFWEERLALVKARIATLFAAYKTGTTSMSVPSSPKIPKYAPFTPVISKQGAPKTYTVKDLDYEYQHFQKTLLPQSEQELSSAKSESQAAAQQHSAVVAKLGELMASRHQDILDSLKKIPAKSTTGP